MVERFSFGEDEYFKVYEKREFTDWYFVRRGRRNGEIMWRKYIITFTGKKTIGKTLEDLN